MLGVVASVCTLRFDPRHTSKHKSVCYCCYAYSLYMTKYSETSIKRHLRDLPKCPLNRGCKNCAMFVNDQHSTVTLTVIKLHVVKEAIQSSNSLPFITNFNLFINAKTLTEFSTYFKDVIQYYYCQFSPMSA